MMYVHIYIYIMRYKTRNYPHIQANSSAGRTGIWWALERYLCLVVWIPCSSMHGHVDIIANMMPIVSTPASNALGGVGWQLNWLNHRTAHPSPFTPENGFVCGCWISSTFDATLLTALGHHNESKRLLPSKAHRHANGLGSLEIGFSQTSRAKNQGCQAQPRLTLLSNGIHDSWAAAGKLRVKSRCMTGTVELDMNAAGKRGLPPQSHGLRRHQWIPNLTACPESRS